MLKKRRSDIVLFFIFFNKKLERPADHRYGRKPAHDTPSLAHPLQIQEGVSSLQYVGIGY
jgi:hypothetical protein